MSKSFRIQENVYNTFLKLKNRKKQQQFLEKCFIYAWENREIETDYDVDLAFCGVKPSIKLSNNGGGLNNPTGINKTKSLKNKENNISDNGQSEVRVRSDSGQTLISNKYISNKDINNNIKEKYKKEFEKFWSIYPKTRAGSKDKAYKSYVKAIDSGRCTIDKIYTSAYKYSQSKEVANGYAKGCAAWLNDDRFNNEYVEYLEEQY